MATTVQERPHGGTDELDARKLLTDTETLSASSRSQGSRVDEESPFRRRSWRKKFSDAFRGIGLGVRGHSSFWVHLLATVAVVVAAAASRASLIDWCLLILCISTVLAAEAFNSALEELAKALTDRFSPYVRDALDMASAAVLLAALGAAAVGTVVLVNRGGIVLGWWG